MSYEDDYIDYLGSQASIFDGQDDTNEFISEEDALRALVGERHTTHQLTRGGVHVTRTHPARPGHGSVKRIR